MKLPELPPTASVEATVDATPEQVWAVISDVTRIGEWSHECREAKWVGGATHAVPGARFRGRNRVGLVRWGRICTITEVDPPLRFTYHTFGKLTRDSTQWTIELQPEGSGTRIVMGYEALAMPRAFELVILATMKPHWDRTAALQGDLQRLGRVAAGAGQETAGPASG
ncbi:SRPBCC family protein [Aldersonia kunmingensis]|uniref:SRPBCC family protein n=1 Tax=Aldersonia kunmingensis TaxID=408066 RepID=UPI00082A40B5|nr:SRPBCC family protein [Aldersonia kunmingensis]